MPNPNLPIGGDYNVYIGARYVPLVMGAWSATADYEPLSIVTFEGNSYTSKTFVPAGTPVTNATYWAATGNYNAQVEQYRQEVRQLTETVNNINKYNPFIILDEYLKGGFADDALTQALQLAEETGQSIITMGGEYSFQQGFQLDSVFFNLNGGTITGNITITLKNDATLFNGKLNGCSVIIDGTHSVLEKCFIKNWSGIAIHFTSGYESSVNLIYFENDSSGQTIGIQMDTADAIVSNVYGYGAYFGIICNSSNNIFENIHLWMMTGNSIIGSVFFTHNSTRNVLTNCTSDTYDIMIKSQYPNLALVLSGCQWFNNPNILNNHECTLFTGGNSFAIVGEIFCNLGNTTAKNITLNIGNATACNIFNVDGEFVKFTKRSANNLKPLIDIDLTFTTDSVIECNQGRFRGHLSISAATQQTGNFSFDISGFAYIPSTLNIVGWIQLQLESTSEWRPCWVSINNTNKTLNVSVPNVENPSWWGANITFDTDLFH